MYSWAGVSVWMIGLIWKITVFYIGSVLIWAYNGYVALATLARTYIALVGKSLAYDQDSHQADQDSQGDSGEIHTKQQRWIIGHESAATMYGRG